MGPHNRAKKKYDEFRGEHEPTVRRAATDLKHGVGNFGTKLRGMGSGMRRSAQSRSIGTHTSRQQPGSVSYGAQVLAGISLPVLSAVSAALLVSFLALFLLLTSANSVIGWIPETWLPMWLALALLVVAYLVVAAPIGIVRRASHRYANGGSQFGWASALDAILWLALVGAFSWAVYQFIPGVSEALAELFGAAARPWFV